MILARPIQLNVRPTGLQGVEDLLTGEGAQVHLYHHVSISETVLTVAGAGLAFYLVSQILKFKKK